MEKNSKTIRKIQWYIVAGNGYTYQSLLEMLSEDDIEVKECVDGVERKLWKCDYDSVCKILKNKEYKSFDFTIHKKVGDSPIRECHLSYSKLTIKRLRYA